MAFDFPNSPTVGQLYTAPTGLVYTWDGQKWGSGSGYGAIYISDSAPAAPVGSLWWESDTGNLYVNYNDGNSIQWVMIVGGAPTTVMRSYLAGLTLSTPGSSVNFTVQPGQAADSTNTAMMTLAAAMTKTTGSWASGSGNGGLDVANTTANTWYHVYLIRNPTFNTVDVIFSLSATAPTLSGGFTQFRRIGSMATNALNQWAGFTQTGDLFEWTTIATDLNSATIGTTATLVTLLVPHIPGIRAIIRGLGAAAASGWAWVYSTSITALDNNSPTVRFSAGSVANSYGTEVSIPAGAAQVIAISTVANTTLTISVWGWIDRRGRDA